LGRRGERGGDDAGAGVYPDARPTSHASAADGHTVPYVGVADGQTHAWPDACIAYSQAITDFLAHAPERQCCSGIVFQTIFRLGRVVDRVNRYPRCFNSLSDVAG
jgi:hypothetical protein